MMISKPNFTKAEGAAYKLLEKNGVNSLPIKLKKLAKQFPNLKIKSYTWFANKHGMTIEEVCEFANSNEGCCWYRKNKNQYIILYNDLVENKGRIRWTIAHELGHFVLRHNELTNKTKISRSSLTDDEYDIFEKEANCFARSLLAPPNVIAELNIKDTHYIMELCELSLEAAGNVMNFLIKGFNMGRRYSPKSKVTQLFSQYIYQLNNTKHCKQCNYLFFHETAVHCPVCSHNNLSNRKGFFLMKYEGYHLKDGRPVFECPVCKNEEVDHGEFCKVCGITVVNKCTHVEYDFNGQIYYECGTLADGDARYCIKCGSKTTYFENGLLKDWVDEVEEKQNESPFGKRKVVVHS